METSKVECTIVEDRPNGGMWHCGPNAFWLTVTDKQTGSSVRVYSGGQSQFRVRENAMMLLELAVELARGSSPLFPERLAQPKGEA